MAMFRVAFGFVLVSFVVKLALKRLNGFDALGLVVLGGAVLKPFLGEVGYVSELVIISFSVAVIAASGGGSRRGVLFISATLLLTDVMVDYEHFIPRRADDMHDEDACTPVDMAAAVQVLLFCFVSYAASVGGNGSHNQNMDDEREVEMRTWLAAIIAASAVRSMFVARECRGEHYSAVLFNMFRVAVLAGGCVMYGEDELKSDEAM